MVIITLPTGSDWYKANWVFRQFRKDIADFYPQDNELNIEMEKAGAFGSLDLKHMENGLRKRILCAMTTVAEAIAQGRLLSWSRDNPHDEEGQRMYLESIVELLDALTRQA